jgi:hypothetical protein
MPALPFSMPPLLPSTCTVGADIVIAHRVFLLSLGVTSLCKKPPPLFMCAVVSPLWCV